jgi:hypothetical protein
VAATCTEGLAQTGAAEAEASATAGKAMAAMAVAMTAAVRVLKVMWFLSGEGLSLRPTMLGPEIGRTEMICSETEFSLRVAVRASLRDPSPAANGRC